MAPGLTSSPDEGDRLDHTPEQTYGSKPRSRSSTNPHNGVISRVSSPEPALLHRSLFERPVAVKNAHGSWLYLSEDPDNCIGNGGCVLDGCGGAAVAVIGHGNLEVIDATVAQMRRVAYVHTGAYTTLSAEDLADFLLEDHSSEAKSSSPSNEKDKPRQNPFGFTRAWLGGSGSEATEAAMKLARQFFFEKGGVDTTTRTKWIVRRQGYHGNTIGAMSVSGNMARREPYEHALVLPVGEIIRFVSPAFQYRGRMRRQLDDCEDEMDTFAETEEEYAARLVRELEDDIIRAGPESVIGFMAETMVGATTGCVTAPRGYFKGVREVCDKYGILLILDEIMCGVGRTGTYFAFEQEGTPEEIRPDIVMIGKGLGGGYAPVSAVLVHDHIVSGLRRGSASFCHGHTYQAHAVGCAAALAVQRIIQRDELVKACAVKGRKLGLILEKTFGGRLYVGDVRGRGLFWALEFVQSRQERRPFPRSVGFASRVQARAFKHGLAIYPGQGTVDGIIGDHVLVAPPLNITDQELEFLVAKLLIAYSAVEREVTKEIHDGAITIEGPVDH